MQNSPTVSPLFSEEDYINGKKNGQSEFHFKCKKCHHDFWSCWNDGSTTKKCPNCGLFGGSSQAEKDIKEFCHSLLGLDSVILNNDRNVIAPLELDIVIPSRHLAIEYDGLYWHSDDNQLDYKYHLKKTQKCSDVGYQLIHIFENEWYQKQDIVKSRLKSLLGIYDNIVYARKCEVKEVSSSTSRSFLE